MATPPPLQRATGISDTERDLLVAVVDRRVGARAQSGEARELVDAYLRAVERHAFVRTAEGGPVPTSLTVERSSVLIEISRQLKRVIQDYEIRALFRVTAPQAKSMRTTLLATYGDDVDELTFEWSLTNATVLKTDVEEGDVTGDRIKFETEDKLEAFKEQCDRAGVALSVMTGDGANPHLAVVEPSYVGLRSAANRKAPADGSAPGTT